MASQATSYHDIEWNGKRYIMEWRHTSDEAEENGYIGITEACTTCDTEEEEEIEHSMETYDFWESY